MEDFIQNTKISMNKAVKFLEEEYKLMKIGRANPRILDKIFIDYYGSKTPINQLSVINVEGRTILIKPWDTGLIREIEKEILKNNLGVTPQCDGEKVILTFPVLSEEERIKISKVASKVAEDTKVTVRNVRRDVISKINSLKKIKELSEDEAKKLEKKVQDIINSCNNKIENMCEEKKNDIMRL